MKNFFFTYLVFKFTNFQALHDFSNEVQQHEKLQIFNGIKVLLQGRNFQNLETPLPLLLLGKKAWKITLLPMRLWQEIMRVFIPIVKITVKMLLLDMEGEIELEVSILIIKQIYRRKMDFSKYLLYLMILNQLNLLVLLFFRFMSGEIQINKDIQE